MPGSIGLRSGENFGRKIGLGPGLIPPNVADLWSASKSPSISRRRTIVGVARPIAPGTAKTFEVTFKAIPDKVAGDAAEIEGCLLKILCNTDIFTKTKTAPASPTP